MKIHQPIAQLCLAALLTALLSGCSTAELQKLNNDLAGLNGALAGRNTTTGATAFSGSTMATMPAAESDKKQVTQLVIPADPRTRAAMDAALPNVKKVLQIHQCIREFESLRQLNIFAVPGMDMSARSVARPPVYMYPNNEISMKFHDRNKCVSIKSIDSWSMPALNALQFRTVYFADDSGETINFQYLFKKIDDGSWKIEAFEMKR